MSLPQRTPGRTRSNDHQLVRSSSALVSSRYGNGADFVTKLAVPRPVPRGRHVRPESRVVQKIDPQNVRHVRPAARAAPKIDPQNVQKLVARFLHNLELPASLKRRPKYHVVHLASEMAPVAKVGGLGDVVTGLARALQNKGHQVEIIIPKYRTLDLTAVKDLQKLNKHFDSYFEGSLHKNEVWTGEVEGLPVYFIDPQHPAKLFDRDSVYCEPDDVKRFTYFSRAALEFLVQFGKQPDIIHCHDWPVAVVAPLYKSIYAKSGLNAKIAFTCHNFEPQGKGSMEELLSCGIQFNAPLHKDHFQDDVLPDKINPLKSGLLHADFITTVSPTYAKEVLTPQGGDGLHTTLRKLTKKFYGVVNGIDDNVWNPATDTYLKHHFSTENLKGKEVLKNNLRRSLGMSTEGIDAKRPLVCCVSRLVPQKGVHLLRSAIFHTLKRGGQFILQGTSQVPSIKKEFDELAKQFENHPHIRLVLRVEETLTRNIYAAADIFVIPSISEPCGLTQMYSMRYGTIPVVRKTGGLADSVCDVDQKHIPVEKRNGFVFVEPSEQALAKALDRALQYYKERPQWWTELVKKVMSFDMSWDAAPINQYIKLYEKAVEDGHPSASVS